MSEFTKAFVTASPYLALAAIIVLAIVCYLWFDTAREKRRRRSIAAAQLCRLMGLNDFAAVYDDYAIGDYSGLTESIANAVRLMANSEQLAAYVFAVAKTVTTYVVQHEPAKADELRAILDGAKAAAAVTAAAVTGAKPVA